ncbi:transmembrane protein 269 isoform X1 [Halichoerus grypus]
MSVGDMQGRGVCRCASIGSVLVYWGYVEWLAAGGHEGAVLFGPTAIHFRRCHCASWMLLISFLLDMAVGAITRHLSLCSKSGVELNDFAIFTTFGLASALLLGVDGPLSGFLAVIYVLAATFRLCFYSTADAQLTYRGLPCRYASCVLASTSLLTKGNTFILSCMASLMVLFMMDQSYYPHDEILESENWKKLVYLGGAIMLLLSPFSLTAFYCLLWSLSYIFFPDALWGKAARLRLQCREN